MYSIMDCQPALAAAHVPAYLSLLPIRSSMSQLLYVFCDLKKSQIPDPEMGPQFKI